MPRPAIGVCGAPERARHGSWDHEVLLVPRAYLDALHGGGAAALVLAPDDELAQQPGELLDRLDGLLLIGGRDIDPLSYGARREEETDEASPERDRFELALATEALERDLPLLGVCRGMQLLNVACGGTLAQRLPADAAARHRREPGSFAAHDVILDGGSLAARAAGGERIGVRSHHRQGIGELGEGLVASGRCPEDGLIEAIELPARRFALGVLWHAEEDPASGVIAALAAEAAG